MVSSYKKNRQTNGKGVKKDACGYKYRGSTFIHSRIIPSTGNCIRHYERIFEMDGRENYQLHGGLFHNYSRCLCFMGIVEAIYPFSFDTFLPLILHNYIHEN
jgi:hypothetical protein